MRDQVGGVMFSPPIERKKVNVKLSGREDGNEVPRRRPIFGSENNYGNGGVKSTGTASQGGTGRLKGGSLVTGSSNGGRNFNEELLTEARSSPVSKSTDEGLLPQWGRGKRSRGSRPDKYTPSSPVQESSAPPPTKKHLLNGMSSSNLRSPGFTKPPSSKHNAPDLLVSGNTLALKPVNGLDHTNGLDPARQISNWRERASSSQKRSVDHSCVRQQQRSDGSDLATTNGPNNYGENTTGAYRTTNVASIMSDVNGLECNRARVELPRISLTLSRKEKEDDFIIFKGSKLPQRPRKRLKVVEKALLFCSPGNWLNDISRGRYDVREKKSTKKKPRGLKAMDSADSDSE